MKTKTYCIICICMAQLLCSCGKKESAPGSGHALKVATHRAVSLPVGEGKEYTFIARPFRTSELSFRVGGPIDTFDTYAGRHYRRGDVIAGIDPRDFRIRRERAEALYRQAKAEAERIEALYRKNSISASTYEKARADYTTAKTAFETAENELRDTRLTAPFNGYIGEVYLEKYQDAKAAQPVVSLIDIDQLRIEVYATQEVALTARRGDVVEVRFDACPDRVYEARIAEVSKGTTRNNLSYLITALLPNADGALLAGMSGKVRLSEGAEGQTAVCIPQTALCHRPTKGDYVWVVDAESGQATHRQVSVGDILPNGFAVVLDGLQAGETVATSGLRFLSDGTKVSGQ